LLSHRKEFYVVTPSLFSSNEKEDFEELEWFEKGNNIFFILHCCTMLTQIWLIISNIVFLILWTPFPHKTLLILHLVCYLDDDWKCRMLFFLRLWIRIILYLVIWTLYSCFLLFSGLLTCFSSCLGSILWYLYRTADQGCYVS